MVDTIGVLDGQHVNWSTDALWLPANFAGAIAAVYSGREPFRWQSRLYKRLLANDIPAIFTLPTGLGKTSGPSHSLVARASSLQHGGWGVVPNLRGGARPTGTRSL